MQTEMGTIIVGNEGPSGESSLYAPDGSLCATVSFTEEMSGTAVSSSYYDANDNFLAKLDITSSGGPGPAAGSDIGKTRSAAPPASTTPKGSLLSVGTVPR